MYSQRLKQKVDKGGGSVHPKTGKKMGFDCVDRDKSIYDYPGCPFNTDRPIAPWLIENET